MSRVPLLGLVLFAACSTQPPAAARIDLTPASATVVVGATVPFSAQVFDAAGKALTTGVTWEVADGAVATIDPGGLLTARAVGQTEVIARAGSASAHAPITVTPATHTLTVRRGHDGGGHVTSTPAGLDCDFSAGSSAPDCAAPFPIGGAVALVVAAHADSTFSGWGAPCSGTGSCAITLTQDTAVEATLDYQPLLTVQVSGSGTVTSSPPGISCGGLAQACSARFPEGATVLLTAAAGGGAFLARWGGSCSGSGACAPRLDSDTRISATFLPVNSTLSVTVTGSGTVTSNPAGLSCPGTCSATFPTDTSVVLTAAPAAGQGLLSWSGACSGPAATCAPLLEGDTAVSAAFTPLRTVSVTISGRGSVTSAPAGLSCASGTCPASFPSGTNLALTATPADANAAFSSWGGACQGQGRATCGFQVSADSSATATFVETVPLTVAVVGNGSVSSTPAGIACPGSCSARFAAGSAVTLTATAQDPNLGLTAWSGACSGNGGCTFTLSAPSSVQARFGPRPIESVTMTLSASTGGTLTLPSGSSVTIPPGALPSNGSVTLSLQAIRSALPPSGLLKTVGPVLALTFTPTPGALQARAGAPLNDLNYTINASNSTGVDLGDAAVLAMLGNCFQGQQAVVDAQSKRVTGSLNLGQASPYSIEVSATTFATPDVPPPPPPPLGPRLWNGSSWVAFDPKHPPAGFNPKAKTLVLVHGIFSSVENAYAGSACVNQIAGAGRFTNVLGYNYDWRQRVGDSGLQLSAFLDSLHDDAKVGTVSMEAHSLGAPVSVAAIAYAQSMVVDRLASIGGPLLGTPAAASANRLLTLLGYSIPDTWNDSNTLLSSIDGPFRGDVTPNSQTLTDQRNLMASLHPGTQVLPVGGTATLLGAPSGCEDVFARIFGAEQNDGVVNLGSSAPSSQVSGLPDPPPLVYPLNHTEMTCNGQVIADVGAFFSSTLALSPRTIPASVQCLLDPPPGSGTFKLWSGSVSLQAPAGSHWSVTIPPLAEPGSSVTVTPMAGTGPASLSVVITYPAKRCTCPCSLSWASGPLANFQSDDGSKATLSVNVDFSTCVC